MFTLTLGLPPTQAKAGNAMPGLPEGEAYLTADTETANNVYLVADTDDGTVFLIVEE